MAPCQGTGVIPGEHIKILSKNFGICVVCGHIGVGGECGSVYECKCKSKVDRKASPYLFRFQTMDTRLKILGIPRTYIGVAYFEHSAAWQ